MKARLHTLGITQSDLAKGAGLSRSTVSRLVTLGKWPKLRTEQVKARVETYLTQAQKKLAPASSYLAEAIPEVVPETETTKEEIMLLQYVALTPQAREYFSLPRSPFVNDVQTAEDVFESANISHVRAALFDAAQNAGFMAVVGESGSGKSTLAEDLEDRVRTGSGQQAAVLIIRPVVRGMEVNDIKGKTLKISQIEEAIILALDPDASFHASPQRRGAQVQRLLSSSALAGRRHLLLIEEAHCMPNATLKHLKRFNEIKDGKKRLLGVACLAQPELKQRLSSQNAEVREVMQRFEMVELMALGNDLERYLRHKFARFKFNFDAVFSPSAIDAIDARLSYTPRGGKPADRQRVCFPLVVNNLVCRAMNLAAVRCQAQVDAQVIAGC